MTPAAAPQAPRAPRWRAARARLARPSISRRVLGALLAAFALVFVVLVAIDYGTFKRGVATRKTQLDSVTAVAATLDGQAPADAVTIVRAAEQVFNRLRHDTALNLQLDDVLFRLEDREGRTRYSSPALGDAPIAIDTPPAGSATVRGRNYWAAVADTRDWRLVLLEPPPDDRQLLRLLGSETLVSMLIALPLVLLPLWLAVRTGLKPLRAFAEQIAHRSPDDLAPLPAGPRHAELRPVATAFDALLAKARAGIVRERSFVQDAAHELRTPLAVIAAEAHNLGTAGDEVARARGREALEAAVGRASRLVHQLLALARVDGAPLRSTRPGDVVEEARRALIDLSALADARGSELSLDAPAKLDATLDWVLFHTVADNLLRNALTHCPPGTRVALRLGLGPAPVGSPDGAGLWLAVLDDGPGIAEADRPRLFERFHRGAEATAAGTGLGLAIVSQAAQAMGATITVGPGLDGRGVGFWLRWARAEARILTAR